MHYTGDMKERKKNHRVFWICLRKARSGKSHDYPDIIVFKKLLLPNIFRPWLKRKAGAFKFRLRLEERIPTDSSVDDRPLNRRNKVCVFKCLLRSMGGAWILCPFLKANGVKGVTHIVKWFYAKKLSPRLTNFFVPLENKVLDSGFQGHIFLL